VAYLKERWEQGKIKRKVQLFRDSRQASKAGGCSFISHLPTETRLIDCIRGLCASWFVIILHSTFKPLAKPILVSMIVTWSILHTPGWPSLDFRNDPITKFHSYVNQRFAGQGDRDDWENQKTPKKMAIKRRSEQSRWPSYPA